MGYERRWFFNTLAAYLAALNYLRRGFGRLVESLVFYGATHRRCASSRIKKGAAKLLQRLSYQSRLPPTGSKRLFFIVTLPSTGRSQKVVAFSTVPHPLPYPLRTGGRPDTYTPASAALPSQPLYQAAFEHVRDLHSLTT